MASLQETFQYILVDEYQDTNAAQASIINYIADSPVNEARPNVMVVGDDDQAIYGFQGALGDILMDFRERWREVKVIILKENYRSTRSILDLSRGVITRGRNRLENHYEDIDKTLHSNTKYTDIMPTQYETNSSQAAIEKAVIAAQSNDNRQLAIIASKHKYLRDLAKQLDKAKVSYYYEGREGLLEDPVIEDLLLLADLLLAISQNNLIRTSYVLPEIIAKGLVEIPRLEAWRIALDAKTHKYSWWEAIQVNQSQHGGAIQEIKILAEALNVREAAASLKQTARHYKFRVLNKIQKLIDHSASYYGRSDLTLGEILRYVELCKQAGIALEQKIVKGKEHSKVILLSAHKSKGQEFDRVYVLHADYNTWFREAGKRNNLVLPENWKLIEPRSMDEDDRLRLLYVVMTRAKQELSLIKGNPNAQTVPGAEEIKTIQIVSEQIEAFSPPDEESWRSWYLPKNKAEQIQLKDFLAPILASYRLSPSHLTSYLDIAHGGPETFFSSVLLEIPEPIHPEALFGSYVHRTLRFAQESLNKTGKLPSAQQLSNYFATDFPTIDPRVMKDVLEVVRKYLQNEALPKGGVAEFTFSNKNVSFDGVALTGTVDNYVLKDNKLTITDFKTGRVLNSWQVREDYYAQKLHRFRQQLLFYELLFRLSSDFSSVEVIVSKISFVEATQRGTYHELTLDADKDERRRLELLIQAVQQKIKNLEFASIAQYSADLHGLKQFEEDLEKKIV